MDVVERIKAELGSSPVVLFMKALRTSPQMRFFRATVARCVPSAPSSATSTSSQSRRIARGALQAASPTAHLPAAVRQGRA